MYKVLTQNAKLPIIAGNNKKSTMLYNQDHELECPHPSLQAEFDALVSKNILAKIEKNQTKESLVAEKDKKDKIIK